MKLSHITTLKSVLSTLWANKKSRMAITFGAAVLLIAAIVLSQAILFTDKTPATISAEAYKEQLEGQVTDQEGAPRDGRDPATQRQTSLADSASKPSGVGQRVNQPAEATDDHHGNHTTSQQNAIGSNGCYTDYGIQGEQCLPAHAGGTSGQLTCNSVHSHGFPNGIKVTGTDRFHLDANHDGVACGSGD